MDRRGVDHGARGAAARRTVLPYVRLPGLFRGIGAVAGRAAVRPRGERCQGVVRIRFVPPAARRIREDRHGSRAGPRDERLLFFDQPSGRPLQGGRGDLHPAFHHHPAERHRFGHRARLVPLRALPRGTQQVALHPGAADRRAVHRVVPAFAHDAARVDHSGLHALRSDDDRGVVLAPDLSGVAGAGEHPALHDDGARRARRDGPARLPADRDAMPSA